MEAEKYISIASNGNTLVPPHKLNFLWESVKSSPGGDIVEVGTWRGGTSLVIAASARKHKPTSTVYLCDTYKGIALAGPEDNYHKDGDFGDATKEQVNKLLTDQELNNFKILEGIFPHETAHLIPSIKISFLHIDVDVYAGYIAILKWAQDRLVDNAIIVFDDYSAQSCLGAKKAVDEYFKDRNDFEIHLTTENTSSWVRYKPTLSLTND